MLVSCCREIIQACYSWEKFRRSKEDLLEFVMLLMVGAYLVATEFGPRILSTHFGAWSIFFVSYMGTFFRPRKSWLWSTFAGVAGADSADWTNPLNRPVCVCLHQHHPQPITLFPRLLAGLPCFRPLFSSSVASRRGLREPHQRCHQDTGHDARRTRVRGQLYSSANRRKWFNGNIVMIDL